MSPDYRALHQTKAALLLEYLDGLQKLVAIPLAEYLARRDVQLQIERLSQLSVECAIDMATALLEASGQAPTSAREAFEKLPSLLPASATLCRRFAKTHVGFRNRLVHDYEVLDQKIVYATAHKLVPDGRRLLQAIAPLARTAPPPRRNGSRRRS